MSDPAKVLAQSLLFPELRILKTKYKGNALLLDVIKESRGEVCPGCASFVDRIYDHRRIQVKDEPVRGHEVVLSICKRRFKCRNCEKIFSEPVTGILPRRRTTQRFRKAILEACENYQSLKKVIKKFRCSSSLIYNALYEQLELRRRTRMYPWPEVIGIDEISFRRNKQLGCTEYATVLVDIKNKRVMELVMGKSKKALLEALSEIPGRENVRCVVMDMCDPFRNFVKEFFPNATIVADKFHTLRLPTPSLLSMLKEEIPSFSDRRHMKRLLLSRPQDLDYFERSRLYKFLQHHPKLDALYTAKERLFAIYAIRFSDQAPRSYERLLGELKTSIFEEVQKLGRTLKRWQNEVLAYFKHRRTNGIVEGFNNKIKVVKRMAYGYRSFRNFRLRVLNACSG